VVMDRYSRAESRDVTSRPYNSVPREG